MNKSELVDQIADATRLPKNEVEVILNKSMELIQKAVQSGDDVTLSGFGTFSKTKRKARKGYNPHTGQEMKIPAMTLPKFKAGKDFRKALSSS